MPKKQIRFLGISSGIGAPTQERKMGAELGFDAIRYYATIARRSTIFLDNVTEEVVSSEDLYGYLADAENRALFVKDLTEPNGTRFARHIGYFEDVFSKIHQAVIDTLETGGGGKVFPFVIAGDHFTAAATIGGLKKYLSTKTNAEGKIPRLGIVWLDAHVDAHTPYSTPSGNMHGMPIGMALGLTENLDPDEANHNNFWDLQYSADPAEKAEFERVYDAWSRLYFGLKKGEGVSSEMREKLLIKPEDLYYVSIRSWEPHEGELLLQRDSEGRGIQYLHLSRKELEEKEMLQGTQPDLTLGKPKELEAVVRCAIDNDESTNLRNIPMNKIAPKVLEYFADYDYLYVSFDMDSLDASLVPGTGTPVEYGLQLDVARTILKGFWEHKGKPELIAQELVEVNPLLDHKNKTARLAYYLIEELVNANLNGAD